MNLLRIRNGNLPYVVQNERYASSGVSVFICNTIERSLDPCNTKELSLTPCNTEIY